MDATTGRIARWATMLAEYEPFEIQYRKGSQNKVADALSRVYAWSECMPDVAFACGAAVQTATDDEEEWFATPDTNAGITIPSTPTLLLAQANDDFCLKKRLECGNKQTTSHDGYIIRDSLVGVDVNGHFTPVLPECLCDTFVQQVHAHPLTALLGAKRTAARCNDLYIIPKLRQRCRQICKDCIRCTQRKRPAIKAGMLASKLPVRAWEMISMDYCGPYPESREGNRYVLVIIDQFTKYVHLTPCANANARTAYRALYEKIICGYGCPDKLLSDNGRHFKNAMLSAVCSAFRIFQTHSSPYYPEGDGQVERFMRNMNDSLAALCGGKIATWCDYVHGIQAAYNMTPHAVTCVPPYTLLFGRKPPPIARATHVARGTASTPDARDEASRLKSIIENSHVKIRGNVEKAWLQRAFAYNKGRSKISIAVGDRCLTRLNPAQLSEQSAGKLRVKWSEPAMVTAVKESGKAFEVTTSDGAVSVVSATKILPLPPSIWTPKRPADAITWDATSPYIPEFPGPGLCLANNVSPARWDLPDPIEISTEESDREEREGTATQKSESESCSRGYEEDDWRDEPPPFPGQADNDSDARSDGGQQPSRAASHESGQPPTPSEGSHDSPVTPNNEARRACLPQPTDDSDSELSDRAARPAAINLLTTTDESDTPSVPET
jgi:transposase InsO family protein